jgi:predicted HicB family RNase H-like nuclease
MAKDGKKSGLEFLTSGKAEKVAKEVSKETKGKKEEQETKEELPRKMVRVSPEVHAMAKKAGALIGTHMQTYIEQLIHKDFKAKYPELWQRTMDEIKNDYPEHYAMVMAQAKHW